MAQFLSTLNDLLFKMTWLRNGVQSLLINGFNMVEDTMMFNALEFFFYDVIKIFILLSVLIYISGYLQTYITPEKTQKILLKIKGVPANIVGALIGTITPFCSCSSIPIFIGFTKAGLPVGVTFSFLISSPLVDIASVILLASIFNWTVALIYVSLGLLIAVIGGTLIDWFHMEKYVADFLLKKEAINIAATVSYEPKRHFEAMLQVKGVIKRVWLFIILGVAIGAFIHGVIPEAWIQQLLGSDNGFNVLIATFLGVPMYADIFGTLPIAEALVLKGVGLGTVLAFMMAVTALSAPSLIMLKKVVKPRLLLMFVTIVITGILITGYLFNALNIIV
jgi:uncharacterized membrane protein YraQ (UPF0718 family)